MTWRELVYICMDEMKGLSDDFTYTEDHFIFLLSNYRAFILKQRYSDLRKQMPESNYQTICLDLEVTPAICGEPCEGGNYLKSVEKIPFTLKLGNPRVYPLDYFQGDFAFISRDRMRYVGYNKYLQNIIYCTIGPDNYLYLKANNPQLLYLKKVKMTAVFENPKEAFKLQCEGEDGSKVCDILDSEFPLEESLVPPLIELVVKELGNASVRSEDTDNNAKDDIAQ